ncbi:MAG: ribbon-helix-helix domain-containing protein [Alphaproteobacteria bacterium]|nr:ribbon-helix-helix domain-containing protein [Marinicaulis sp.]NOX93860.1 ribbon-helix-helix domain-containing protein [Alphaproteobacteria bacterium]
MRKRSISLKGHRTSIALEDAFWSALEEFATSDECSLPQLIYEIDRTRIKETPPPGLASALRVYVLRRLTAS